MAGDVFFVDITLAGSELMLTDIIDGFFCSSRRRHTSYIGDWSSDVCSSDLVLALGRPLLLLGAFFQLADAVAIISEGALRGAGDTRWPFAVEIGRASWRERV